jgi:hypothetical protein
MAEVPPPAPATPPAVPAGAYQPAVPGPKQTQSLVGFILGIGSILLAGLGIIGIGLGIAAVVVSNKAKKSEPEAPTWMPTVGLITGIVGIVLSVIIGAATLIVILGSIFATAYYV